ncbi:hypothetical protein ASG49_17240 [Marmoricola sp. Leaf446]|uniref:single-stranded DNA-binding protein n=1 Tax=Marmoricola sp. Leaf446 TaxID=1736379 RepID=UPI00070079E5|nr:single-stranded DNA-binding protein [Marmoricola sp. Leaf446]KQT89489.1 hypothetical protein ASG49_17240 [Marmoricola sp. Leaf446]
MNESTVIVPGWVGGDVDLREVGESQVASFRLASTPRYQRQGEWVDGPTSWFTVNCWRGLARHVAGSVRRGDAVVVHGRLRVDTWTRDDGSTSTTVVVDATSVGHDLNRGTATFTRPARRDPAAAEPGPAVGPPVEPAAGEQGRPAA